MANVLKVAITGNIAAGKTQVEKRLMQKGFKVLDTDIVAHELLENETCKGQIINTFDKFEILENEQISRKKLAQVVFNDEKMKLELENILHPKVLDKIKEFFAQNSKEQIAFVSIPQLFEAKFEKYFDKIILIYSDDKIRLERLMKRNNLDLDMAQKRLSSQTSQRTKLKLSDFVIENNDTIEILNNNIDSTIMHLLH